METLGTFGGLRRAIPLEMTCTGGNSCPYEYFIEVDVGSEEEPDGEVYTITKEFHIYYTDVNNIAKAPKDNATKVVLGFYDGEDGVIPPFVDDFISTDDQHVTVTIPQAYKYTLAWKTFLESVNYDIPSQYIYDPWS